MSTNKHISKRSSNNDLSKFLDSAKQLPQRGVSDTSARGRMIFALDATASRQPSWDRACQIQGQMFLATDKLGGLQLQLCYYRGFNDFFSSLWLNDSQSLLRSMSSVQCRGGYTQLERVLDHSISQHTHETVKAVVIIADAVEENVDTLCDKAGKMGLLNIPLFMFQEGFDTKVQQCFQQMAKLSKGAYAHFDEKSAGLMTDLLKAAATYAAGGKEALRRLDSESSKQLLHQLKAR